MSKNNQQLSSRRTAIAKNETEVIGAEEAYNYAGPIPHPDILKGFSEIDSTFPERIIKIAENHAQIEDKTQNKIVNGNIVSVVLGQILSFLFGVIGIAATIFLALKGHLIESVAPTLAVIVQSVVSGIVSSKRNK